MAQETSHESHVTTLDQPATLYCFCPTLCSTNSTTSVEENPYFTSIVALVRIPVSPSRRIDIGQNTTLHAYGSPIRKTNQTNRMAKPIGKPISTSLPATIKTTNRITVVNPCEAFGCISGCERGLGNPSLVSVEKFANALEVEV